MNDAKEDKYKDFIIELISLKIKHDRVYKIKRKLQRVLRFRSIALWSSTTSVVLTTGSIIAFCMGNSTIAGVLLTCSVASTTLTEWHLRSVSVVIHESHPVFFNNPMGEKDCKAIRNAVVSNYGLVGSLAGLLGVGALSGFALSKIVGAMFVWFIMFALQAYLRRRLEKLTKTLPDI